METRANYVLIGAFTVLGIIGALGFFVWLANLQLDRQFADYDILFDNVSGLSVSGNVSFNGVSVGKVTAINLYPKDPSKVIVRIQIGADTPIKNDTTAQLKSQGVTGVSFIEMTGGSPTAPRLIDEAKGEIPVIVAERSVVQALTEDAPNLLAEAIKLIKSVQDFVGPGNQTYVSGILANLDTASSKLQTALTDFSDISKTVAEATGEITKFTGRLDSIGTTFETTLTTANGTLGAAKGAFAEAETTLSTATTTLQKANTTFDTANGVIRDQVPPIVSDVATAVAEVKSAIIDVRAQTQTIMTSINSTSQLAGDRMTQLEGTIKALDTTLATAQTTLNSVTATSGSIDTLVKGDGAALVSDARTTLRQANVSIEAINKVVTEDVPVIVTDVRAAVDTANRVMDQVGKDVTGATGKLDPLVTSATSTLSTATQTFADASRTLNRLGTAMDTVENTLTAAEDTFITANRIIDSEVAPTAADIRQSAAQLNGAIAKVSNDLPEITAEVRATIDHANQVIETINATVAGSAPPIQEFATTGLPQISSLTTEARNLVATLDRLTTRIERDPARFFLGNTPPDFRR